MFRLRRQGYESDKPEISAAGAAFKNVACS